MTCHNRALPILSAALALWLAADAQGEGSIVHELRKARLDRIKMQAFGGVSPFAVMPAAGVEDAQDLTEFEATEEPAPQRAGLSGSITARPAVPRPQARPEKAGGPVAAAGTELKTTQFPVPGAASAGTTFRQEPVERPILPQDRWEELLYAIELNGALVSDGEIVLRSPDGSRLAVEVASAQAWRLAADPDKIIELGGLPYYVVSEIEGGRIETDDATLVLKLTLPPSAFMAVAQDLQSGGTIPPAQSSLGGFLDYDFIALGGESTKERIDGLVELGAFSPLGIGLTSMQFNDVGGDDFDAVRLETTLTRDLPASRASLRIGDSLTTGGSFAASQRFAGLQWATNFATDPNFVSFPLPTIGGLSEQQSVIEVVSDNLSQITTEVPAGPFSLDNIPVVTGGGELQVTVTDLLGREQTVTQPYYVSSEMLKPGLHDFAYELGFERKNFGQDSFDYGDPIVSTTHRYGVSDGLTLEAHGDGDPDGGGLIAGGAAQLGGFGIVSGGIGASGDTDLGEGYLAQLAFDYRDAAFNLGLRTRYTSEDYRSLGGTSSDVEREDQANIGFSIGDFGRLGLLFLNRKFHDTDDSRSLTGSYSMPLMGGSLILNAAHTLEPASDTAFLAAFSMPLSPIRSIATFAERQNDEWRGRVQYRRNRENGDLGLDYRIGGEYSENDTRVDARLGYNFTKVATSLEAERDDQGSDIRAGLSGSLALVDGKAGFSRPLGRAFGLVDLPGYPDVKVFLDNREAGSTDNDGRLLLPSLRPYEANKVSIGVEDLPLEAQVIASEAVAVPFDRSGLRVPLEIGLGRSGTAVLVDEAGDPLPAGMSLISGDGATSAQVARDGLSQIDGLKQTATEVIGELEQRRFVCSLDGLALDGEPFPDLGIIRCGS